MAHIHTGPGQHDHTVSIYIFRTDFSEPKLMLHFHAKMKAYAQFGGHVELNETLGRRLNTRYEKRQGMIWNNLKYYNHFSG